MRSKTVIGGLAVVAALLFAVTQIARADDAEIWALLKKPGHIVLLRHANAPEQPPDADKIDFKDCKTQRNLDEAGRTQAKHVGDEFRKHGIASVRIYSSQYCRAMETARLTRLGAVKEYAALNQTYLADLAGMKEAGDESAGTDEDSSRQSADDAGHACPQYRRRSPACWSPPANSRWCIWMRRAASWSTAASKFPSRAGAARLPAASAGAARATARDARAPSLRPRR